MSCAFCGPEHLGRTCPSRSLPYQTCHRRFQQWQRAATLKAMLRALARDLEERGTIHLSEAYVDGSFAAAKKGLLCWADEAR